MNQRKIKIETKNGKNNYKLSDMYIGSFRSEIREVAEKPIKMGFLW